MYSNFETPHTFTFEEGWDGLFTVVFPGFTWTPESYQVTDLAADLTIDFQGTPVVTPPPAPVYVAPPNGAMDLDYAGQTLVWMEGTPPPTRNGGMKNTRPMRDPATYYEVYFGTDNPPMTMVYSGPNLTWPTGPLMPSTMYYWQVVAGNTAGETPGEVWNFDTMDVPPVYWNVNITSVPTGQPIWVDGADSGFLTPHVFQMMEGTSATYSIHNPMYTWMPTEFVVTNIMMDMAQEFVGDYIESFFDVFVDSAPQGADIWVDGVDSGFNTPYTFNWVEGTDAVITVVLPQYTWMPVQYVITDLMANDAVTFVGTYVPNYYDVTITSVPTGQPIWVDGMDSTFLTPHVFSMLEGTSATYSIYNPLYTWVPVDFPVVNIGMNMAQEFIGTLIPTPPILTWPADGSTEQPYGIVQLSWYVANMPAGAYFNVYFDTFTPPTTLVYSGTNTYFNPGVLMPNTVYYWQVVLVTMDKALYPSAIFMFETGEYMLPVELSAFNATVTADMFVNLSWTTQTETEAVGYNVYRSETQNQADAHKVNLSIVPATNTSVAHTYSYVDDTEGLAVNNTYYYWLENVDMSGMTEMHGPVSVTITGGVTPNLPEISLLANAYPNPFRVGGSATINVSIKAGETGTVTVYNLLGQTVKTFKVNEGNHSLTWNANGNASGIYFYKLSTPSTNVTKKLVIVN